jgi:hypothetical protein
LTARRASYIDGGMSRKEALEAARAVSGECLALRIRRVDRALSRIYDGALRPHGITIAQLGLLTATMLAGPSSRPGSVRSSTSSDRP